MMSFWNRHRVLRDTLKLAGAGATLVTVAFSIVTFGDAEGPQVQEAKADIWSLSFGENDNQKKFVDSLMAEGMEKPRVFDWNGNTVFFSTMATDDSPVEVMRKFQDSFVEHGLNQKAHHTVLPPVNHAGLDPNEGTDEDRARMGRLFAAHFEQKDDMFTGGVVPMVADDSYVQMIGVEAKGDPKDSIDFLNLMADGVKRKETMVDRIEGIRFVEAFKEGNGGGRTRVTATWSDEDFEFRQFLPEKQRPRQTVSAERTIEIPRCLGCERLMYFQGLTEADAGYANEIFQSPQGPTETLMFYDESLKKRGWRMADSTKTMLAAKRMGLMEMGGGQLLHYARGDEFISVVAYPEPTGSTVQLMQSP